MISFIVNFIKSKYTCLITNIDISALITIPKNLLNKLLQKEQIIKKEGETQVATTTGKKTVFIREEKRFHNWFPFVMFYGNGKIQPIYVFVTIFCSLSAWMLYIKTNASRMVVKIAIENKTFNYEMLSEIIPSTDLGIVLGFVSTLILLYNSNKNKSQNNGN